MFITFTTAIVSRKLQVPVHSPTVSFQKNPEQHSDPLTKFYKSKLSSHLQYEIAHQWFQNKMKPNYNLYNI